MNEPRGFQLAGILVVVLSAFDSAFTHLWLASGVATEANPIMAAAWSTSPATFHVVKFFLVLFGAGVLHQLRRTPGAQNAMAFALAAYGAVVSWHLLNV